LHFNDVYEIEPLKIKDNCAASEQIIGGAARFTTAFKRHNFQDKLVLFSGDIFGPSLISAHYTGSQMVDYLKTLNVECCCLGNHETEYGLNRMQELIQMSERPWLLSNFFMEDGSLLPGCQETHITEFNGVKIGLMGLCDDDWLEIISP
jgi:5'-nucleotidase